MSMVRMWRSRLVLVLVVALAMGVALPPNQPSQPGESEFPLAGLWEMITTSPAWSFDKPSTPVQGRGGAMPAVEGVSGTTTRAGGGNGRPAPKLPGAGKEYVAPQPERAKQHVANDVARGFDAATSKLDMSAATETALVYRNADGSITKQVYGKPVNYKGTDGVWRRKSDRLLTGEDGRLRPTGQGTGLSFAGGLGKSRDPDSAYTVDVESKLVSLTLPGGGSLSYGLQGAANVVPSVAGETVTYGSILPGTDLKLTTLDGGTKEEIVLRSTDAATEWVFPLALTGVTMKLESDGSISLRDKSGKKTGTIPHAWMMDSKIDPRSGDGAFSDKVRYELVKLSGGRQGLKVIADREWIRDPARVFPITVDPTYVSSSASTYVMHPYTLNRSGEDRLKLGWVHDNDNNVDLTAQAFLDFGHITQFFQGKRITAADMYFNVMWSGTCGSGRESTVSAHEITQSWSPDSAVSWNTRPSVNQHIGSATGALSGDGCGGNSSKGTQWRLELNGNGIDMLKRWTTVGGNHGISLLADTTTYNSDTWKQISSVHSALPPFMYITYTDNVAPRVDRQSPPFGYAAPTLTPELSIDAVDPDGWPNALKYQFIVKDGDTVVDDSGPIDSRTYSVKPGKLQWGKAYQWFGVAFDGVDSAGSPAHALMTAVPQPLITSGLAQNPSDRGFEPRVGNFTTQATDAKVASPGPELAIQRSYNSRDPRTGHAFGAGWSSLVDSRVTKLANTIVITYPSGQEVAFGKRPDGSYVAPGGSVPSTITEANGVFTLTDGASNKYVFGKTKNGSTYLTSVTDALGRDLQVGYAGGDQATSLVSGSSGRKLLLTWSNSRVATVANELGEIWKYTYTGNTLTKVCSPISDTQCTVYEYGANSLYPAAALDASPDVYMRLTEPAGAAAAASSAVDSLLLTSGRYVNMNAPQSAGLPGSAATAPVFNGTSSRVELGRAMTYFSGYQTVSLRFKTTTPGVLYSLMGGGWAPVLYVGTDNKIHAKFWNAGDLVSTNTVTDGAWHQVALAGDGNSQRLYLDGVEIGASTGSLNHQWADTAVLGAGRWLNWSATSGDYSYFNGQISDFAHYPRALSASQIATLHAVGAVGAPRLTKIVRPSGGVQSIVDYDPVTGVVRKVTDSNNGVWQMADPARTGGGQSYASRVLGGAPLDYLRMHDQSNEVSRNTALFSNVTLGGPDYLLGPDRQVASFNGVDSVIRLPDHDYVSATPHTYAMWFRTKDPGVLLGLQNKVIDDVTANLYEPALYVGTDGKLHGGYWAAAGAKITSSEAVNDGQWHHVVLSSTGNEQTLYLDGTKAGTQTGSPAQFTPVHPYLGGGRWGGWPNVTGERGFLKGSLAEYAYFRRALTAADVAAQFNGRDLSGTVKALPTNNIVTSGANTVSMWFQQPKDNTTGGVLYSYQSHPIGDPAMVNWNPALYVGVDGLLRGLFWNGGTGTIVGPKVNDGLWHHVVLTTGGGQQWLFLDGTDVGSAGGTVSLNGTRYAFLGGGTWNSWPSTTGKHGIWPGSISGFTFERSQWNASQVSAARNAGRPAGEPEVTPPSATPMKTVKVTDPMGGVVTNIYDLTAGGRQIEAINALGKMTKFGYDTNGFQRSVTDGNKNMTVTERDERGNTLAQIKCQDRAQDKCSTTYYKYFYDAANPGDLRNNRMVEMRDARSANATDNTYLTKYVLNTRGEAVETIDALGRSTKVDISQRDTVLADLPVSGTGQYVRMSGQLTSSPHLGFSLWEIEVYGPNENRNLAAGKSTTTSSIEKAGLEGSMAVDGSPLTRWASGQQSQPEQIIVDLGAPYALNRVKLLWEVAHGRHYTIDVSADKTNWTTLKRFDAANPQTSTFTPPGLPYRTTMPNSARQTATHDGKGDLVESVDAAGARVRYVYDLLGRLVSQTNYSDSFPAGLTTTMTYDKLGRVVSVTEPSILNHISGATHRKVTTTGYNPDGRTLWTTVADSSGGDASRTMSTEYNLLGQRTSQSDAKGNKTLFSYDALGRVIKQISPDGTVTEAGYDLSGQQVSSTINGQLLETRVFDDGGRLAKTTDAMGWETLFWYTDNDLMVKSVRRDPAGYRPFMTEHNTYDDAGNVLTKLTNNGVTQTNYTYDAAGRITLQVDDPTGSNLKQANTYGLLNEVLTSKTSGSTGSQIVDSTYDSSGRTISRSVRLSGGTGSPAGWWKLNDAAGTVAADSAGSRHGNASGGVTWNNGLAELDGQDDHITADGTAVDTTNSYSISFWARTDASGWRAGVSADGAHKSAFQITHGDNWELHQYSSDTDGSTEDTYALSHRTVPLGQWAHVVGVYDKGAGKLRLYLDGTKGSEGNALSSPMASTGKMVIGRAKRDSQSIFHFGGAISNVQAYQRVLTDAEVQGLTAAGRTGHAISTEVSKTSWWRNQLGQPTAETDPMGKVSNFIYDEAGRVVQTISPELALVGNNGQPVTMRVVGRSGYDTFGGQTESQEGRAMVTTTRFDANGRPTETTLPPYHQPGASAPVVSTRKTVYDNMSRVKTEIDPLGRESAYTYDQFGRLLTATGPDGGVSSRTYHLSGQPATMTAPDGAKSEATWDFLGRQVTATQWKREPGQATFALTSTKLYYSHSACKDDGTLNPIGCAGWELGTTSPEPGRTSSTPQYDRLGQVVQVTDPFNNITKYAYDFAGRQTAVILPNGASSTVTFDQAGRSTATRQFAANGTLLTTQSATYDKASRMITATDARGNTATSTYDATGWLTSTTMPVSASESVTTQYAYDAIGNRTWTKDGRGVVFRTTYNTWGLPESTVEPNGHTYTTRYDLAGRVEQVSLPGGVTQTHTYDVMDRPVKSVGTGATTADREWTYDTAGRVKTISGSGGNNTLSYDDLGQLTSVQGPSGNSWFGYTRDGLISQRTDAAGTTSYTYDAGGRLSTATNTGADLKVSVAYNNLSQPSTLTYGTSGNRRTFGYDGAGRVATDELTTPSSASIGKITYGYDANGNLTSKLTAGFAGAAANAYTYDRANQLRTWTTGSSTVDYDYDKAGNRIKAGGRTFTYDDNNRLATSSDGTTYTYTARGTLQSTTTGTVALSTVADAFGQITRQQHSSTAYSDYTYDGLGRVVNTGMVYTGLGNDLAADPAAKYVRGPGGSLLGTHTGGTGTYAWTDLHSDVVAQFTATATGLSGSQTFDPWGKPLAQNGFVGNLGYQSAWTDQNTKRVNMAARWYNPDTGQFDSRDSANVPNRHNYTDNNPLTYTDPSGHQRQAVDQLSDAQAPPPIQYTDFDECDRGSRTKRGCDWRPPRSEPPPSATNCLVANPNWARCTGYFASVGIKVRPNAATDASCRLGANSSAACAEQAARGGETAKCPHSPGANTIVLPVSCLEVNRAGGSCHIGSNKLDMGWEACINFALELDKKGHYFENPDDPVVQQATTAIFQQEAYQKADAKTQALNAKVADAKCNADFWCRNADMVGTVVGAVAGVITGAVCMAATAGAGSIGCMALAGFVGGFVGSLATSVAKGGWDSLGKGETWLNAGIAGGVGALTGALGGVGGAVIGRAVSSTIGRAVSSAIGNAASKAGSRVAATAVGRAASSASNAVSNAARNTVVAAERKFGSTAVGAACEIGSELATEAVMASHSFDPATQVVMADGSVKKIEEVAIGDEVKASDPETGETTSQPVTALHVNADEHLADVTVQDDQTGKTTVLKTTANHPFWSATDREWTDAGDLRVGERLRDDQGKETQQVVSVRTWTGLQRMHDLTVDSVHTYYVLAADKPVLVHNCGGPACKCNPDASEGFPSYNKAGGWVDGMGKAKDFAEPGETLNWEHVVEQSQAAKSGFPQEWINHPDNLMLLDSATNFAKNGYYSKTFNWTGGQSIRNMLTGMPFHQQWDFGMYVINTIKTHGKQGLPGNL